MLSEQEFKATSDGLRTCISKLNRLIDEPGVDRSIEQLVVEKLVDLGSAWSDAHSATLQLQKSSHDELEKLSSEINKATAQVLEILKSIEQ